MRRSGPSGGLTAPQEASGEVIPLGDFTPAQTAHQLLDWLAGKSKISTDRLVILGVLAGAFIAVGGAFFTGVMDVSSFGHGPSRLLGGVVFSCGLLLVCASGAELSTGNCLLATAWATRRITIADLGRNLAISYIANAAGALAFAMLIADSGLLRSEYGRTAAAIAEAKMNLGFGPAFVRGILCNALVCVALWMMVSARTITSKLAGLIFPISAFITLGFEHSIANFYLLTTGLLAHARVHSERPWLTSLRSPSVTWSEESVSRWRFGWPTYGVLTPSRPVRQASHPMRPARAFPYEAKEFAR